jgi:hypothetical protein
MFAQELSKRNMFLLYALAAAPSCDDEIGDVVRAANCARAASVSATVQNRLQGLAMRG